MKEEKVNNEKHLILEKLLNKCDTPENTLENISLLFNGDVYQSEEIKYFYVEEFPKILRSYIKLKNNISNDKYKITNLILSFSSKLDVSIYRYTYYDFFYACRVLISKFNTDFDNKFKKWVYKKWFAICLNDGADYSYKIFFKEMDIDVENEITEIIFDKKNENNLDDFFNKAEWLPNLTTFEEWFLKRYDLITAKKLTNCINKIHA